jgi:hypothetical protein
MMAAPYEVRMDADSARQFAERGGAILMLDVPPGTSMSVDHQARRASRPELYRMILPFSWTDVT